MDCIGMEGCGQVRFGRVRQSWIVMEGSVKERMGSYRR